MSSKKKKIIIFTDTWLETSGVITALHYKKKILEKKGFDVTIVNPGPFFTLPLPTYKEIRMAFPRKKIKEIIERKKPDYIHIETEGSLCLAARLVCAKNNWKFTTSYHTRMPEYVGMRFKHLKEPTYKYLRWIHSKSERVMVSTESMKKELQKKGFKNLVVVPLGVDTKLFTKNTKAQLPKDIKKPVFTFLGRIAPEKNIETFLKCNLPGSKLLIGDGPDRKKLEEKFKGKATFVGFKKGQDLVNLLSISDVLVFPSKTDTFGLVIVEALSCGVPVAAYDVQGPKDIITNGVDGFLGETAKDLEKNAKKCLKLKAKDCRKKALTFSWEKGVEKFIKNLVYI